MQNGKSQESPSQVFELCMLTLRLKIDVLNRAVSMLGLGFANSIQLYKAHDQSIDITFYNV